MSPLLKQRRIYLDYASATPAVEEAVKAYARAADVFANPGSIHADGIRARDMLRGARDTVAADLGVKAREIIFTSGGTEANNLALLGFARKRLLTGWLSGTHWIVSSIEHPSVLECFAEFERMGGAVTHVDPDLSGRIAPEKVAQALRPDTVLVSVGWGNSEIGTLQPLTDIARVIRTHEAAQGTTVIFHADLGQAPLYKHPHVHTLGVDMATLDSGKLYGPRGVGALYVHNRVPLAPILLGGGQERGLRAGTENMALAAGFAAAIKVVAAERVSEAKRLAPLCNELAAGILAAAPGAVINGSQKHALPHILNISLPDTNTEYLALALDAAGIAISTKSACREQGDTQSHVVAALGGDAWRASSTLRFSLGRETFGSDIRLTLAALLERLPQAKQ
jgi:cysteine desulfurase